MLALALLLTLPAATPVPAEAQALLRLHVARTALAQLERPDPAWHPQQRDCAGLVRFAYRSAYRLLRPERLATPLWRDSLGRPSDFADAEALLSQSFTPLGREERTAEQLLSGDLLAFRQEQPQGPVFHLMLVVRPQDKAHAPARVVYHPGEPGAAVRSGELRLLASEAPLEWRPLPSNPAFLGFFRFKEWMQ